MRKSLAERVGLYGGWELGLGLPITSDDLPADRQAENILMKLCTKADRYSSAGTEAGICNWLILKGQAQLA